MTKGFKAMLILSGACMMMGACGKSDGEKIKQVNDTVTVEAGQELHLHASDFLNVKSDKDHDIEVDGKDVDVNKVGKYEVTVKYKKKGYKLTVDVVDTTAPMAEFSERYVTVEDIAKLDLNTLGKGVYDASNYEVTLAGITKVGEVSEVNDEYLAKLQEGIETNQEELTKLVQDKVEMPTEEGVYQAIVSYKDEYNNESLEVVYIVLDKPEAVEVQGQGNQNQNTNTGTKPNTNTGTNANTKPNTNNNTNPKPNTGNANNGGTQNTNKPNNDTSGSDEESKGLTPAQQAAVNAGYYNVVANGNGGFVVLVKNAGESEKGRNLIEQYLNALGLESTGGFGSETGLDNMYIVGVRANQIREKTPDINEDDFWTE